MCSRPAELPPRVSYKSYEYRSYAVYTYICNMYIYAYILLFTDCEYLLFCITIMYSRIHTYYLIWPRYAVNLLPQVRRRQSTRTSRHTELRRCHASPDDLDMVTRHVRRVRESGQSARRLTELPKSQIGWTLAVSSQQWWTMISAVRVSVSVSILHLAMTLHVRVSTLHL